MTACSAAMAWPAAVVLAVGIVAVFLLFAFSIAASVYVKGGPKS